MKYKALFGKKFVGIHITLGFYYLSITIYQCKKNLSILNNCEIIYIYICIILS